MAATVAGILPVFLAGGLAVQISAELGFGPTTLGAAFAGYFACAALTSTPLGRLAEALGATAALRLAAGVSAVLQLAIAATAHAVTTLLPWLVLSGLCNALAQPAANLLIARAVATERQGFACGLKQAAIPITTLLAGLAVPALALTVGWRSAFLSGATFALAAALCVPSVNRVSTTAARNQTWSANGSPAALRLLAVGMLISAAAVTPLGAFLVAGGVQAGLSEAFAGVVLSASSAVGTGMRLLLGAAADRCLTRPLRVVSVQLALGALAFGLLAIGHPGVHVFGAVVAYGVGWSWPGLVNLAVVRGYPQRPAAATGVTQSGTYVGAMLGPLGFGLAAAHWSFAAAWVLQAAWSLLGAAAIALAHRMLGAPSLASSSAGKQP